MEEREQVCKKNHCSLTSSTVYNYCLYRTIYGYLGMWIKAIPVVMQFSWPYQYNCIKAMRLLYLDFSVGFQPVFTFSSVLDLPYLHELQIKWEAFMKLPVISILDNSVHFDLLFINSLSATILVVVLCCPSFNTSEWGMVSVWLCRRIVAPITFLYVLITNLMLGLPFYALQSQGSHKLSIKALRSVQLPL